MVRLSAIKGMFSKVKSKAHGVVGKAKGSISKKVANKLADKAVGFINKRVKNKRVRGFLQNQVKAAAPYVASKLFGGKKQEGGRRRRRRRRKTFPVQQEGGLVSPPFPYHFRRW